MCVCVCGGGGRCYSLKVWCGVKFSFQADEKCLEENVARIAVHGTKQKKNQLHTHITMESIMS